MSRQKKQYIEYEDGTRVELGPDDAPELTEADFAGAKPLNELAKDQDWARKLLAAAKKRQIEMRPIGRPKQAVTKQKVMLRLDPDVIEAFKADGPGWQTRMNAALRAAAFKDE